MDAAHRTKAPLFDQAAIAHSLSQAASKPVAPEHLPFEDVELPAGQSALEFAALEKQ